MVSLACQPQSVHANCSGTSTHFYIQRGVINEHGPKHLCMQIGRPKSNQNDELFDVALRDTCKLGLGSLVTTSSNYS